MAMRRTLTLIATSTAVVFGLVACDPEEQDRPLYYEKGTYLGQEDEPLSPEASEALRQRMQRQRGI